MLQAYVSSVLDISEVYMLQMFYVDVAKVDRDVAYVVSISEARCKRLFKMFHLFLSVFYLDIAYVSHMLQEYVPMVLGFQLFQSYVAVRVFMLQVVSVLSGCCKCFIWMLPMFHIHVSSVCSKYFICFRCMLYSSALCFIGVFRESWSMARAPGDQARRAGCRWSRCVARLGPTDGVCSSASWLPGLARAEREERGRWEGATSTGTGCVCIGGQGRATRRPDAPTLATAYVY
jgi:hypothetical protein